jgi:XrtN system VIT domain protein
MNIYQLFREKAVYVFDDEIKLLNNEGLAPQFFRLQKNQFSIFPLHAIEDPAHSLLISKSGLASPNLADLKNTRFMKDLQAWLQEDRKVKLFNLGPQLSPYLKSLKEYRLFEYEQGGLEELRQLAASRTFAKDIESDAQVVIDNAGVTIVQEQAGLTSTAPDHLMRLFAYNHIMKKMGSRLVTGKELNGDLVEEAKEAYVVSPVSSLVVLETKKDYERFDIKESQNSLQNASMHSKGAVPEPHEWALVILAVLIVLYIKFQPRFRIR